ncbi:permease [bacterium]|nr:permease [bacterium]
MLIPTIIMGVFAIVMLTIGYNRGHGEHIVGLKNTVSLLLEIIPLLICAFIVAGMVQVLIPYESITKWVGAESGLRGIMLGSIAGSLTPGGPFVNLPIAAAMLKAGAGPGTMVAFLTGWSLWAINRLPMEVGILGWKFTLIRLSCILVFPPLSGIIANLFFSGVKNL